MNCKWTNLSYQDGCSSKDGFLNALNIWIEKPHVVNRRLCGAVQKLECVVQCSENVADSIEDLQKKIGQLDSVSSEHIQKILGSYSGLSTFKSQEVIIRNMVPKLEKYNTVEEMVLIDKERGVVTFIPTCTMNNDQRNPCSYKGYRISFKDCRLCLEISVAADAEENEHHSDVWLSSVLLPKLLHWSNEDLKSKAASLRLVPLEKYNKKYQALKTLYGDNLVKIWPECTDPLKFVYEEVAIAAYLMVLFEAENALLGSDKKQYFVDLGCGNGLLTYLLTKEGYPGVGIDVRQRKIWQEYDCEVNLQEKTLTPSDVSLFPEADWLIGNHSDELTPWIPVIAARSSQTCKFFVLPCCPHDFNGKFNDRRAGCSQYQSYLKYVQEVGEKCGFVIEEDSLRIPSTKRICFIGQRRNYNARDFPSINQRISDFIKERSKRNLKRTRNETLKNSGEWAENFVPRESTEKVKNCTTVDRGIQDMIIERVFRFLISSEGAEKVQLKNNRSWNAGTKIPIRTLVEMFDQDTLKNLKSECGGFQTLLKNQHQIFKVVGGMVQLRYEVDNSQQQTKKHQKKPSKDPSNWFKTKMCWFHMQHPDGCPYEKETCSFAHGDEDLQSRTMCQ